MINLPPEVYTLQQLQAVREELAGLARTLDHAAVKQRAGAKPAAALPEPSAEARAVLGAAGAAAGDSQAVAGLLAQLDELAGAAPRVHITLAAMPAEGLKKQLAAWLRVNLHPQVLVTFSYHSALLGGMVVRTGSRVFDWSFRRQILDAAPRFAEVLSHV